MSSEVDANDTLIGARLLIGALLELVRRTITRKELGLPGLMLGVVLVAELILKLLEEIIVQVVLVEINIALVIGLAVSRVVLLNRLDEGVGKVSRIPVRVDATVSGTSVTLPEGKY